MIGGPVDATIYATSTRPDTELVATLEDVAPDGTATPITTGPCWGRCGPSTAREAGPRRTGKYLLRTTPTPWPPSRLSPPARGSGSGSITRYDIEIRPTFAQIDAGHRLRLTLTTSDLPTLLPTAPDELNLIGGVYQVQRNSGASSYFEALSAPASELSPGAQP